MGVYIDNIYIYIYITRSGLSKAWPALTLRPTIITRTRKRTSSHTKCHTQDQGMKNLSMADFQPFIITDDSRSGPPPGNEINPLCCYYSTCRWMVG